ncbi:MAG: hypothetical protein V1806_01880 [Pseudomonadota bacterium]
MKKLATILLLAGLIALAAGCCAPGTPNHMMPCVPWPIYLFF